MTADNLANCNTVGAHRAPLQLNALFQLFLGHHTGRLRKDVKLAGLRQFFDGVPILLEDLEEGGEYIDLAHYESDDSRLGKVRCR